MLAGEVESPGDTRLAASKSNSIRWTRRKSLALLLARQGPKGRSHRAVAVATLQASAVQAKQPLLTLKSLKSLKALAKDCPPPQLSEVRSVLSGVLGRLTLG